MKSTIKIFFLTLCVLISLSNTQAQSDNSQNRSSLGIEVQVYPTGIIPGVRYELPLSEMSNLHLRAGYQIIDHRDLGVQDNETGNGYGFSVGYKRFFKSDRSGLALMLKNDVWFNKIDWEDDLTTPSPAIGTSNITVIQPTLQAEYGFMLGENAILAPSVAFGLEWNVTTDGRETGEGPILLVGVAFSYLL